MPSGRPSSCCSRDAIPPFGMGRSRSHRYPGESFWDWCSLEMEEDWRWRMNEDGVLGRNLQGNGQPPVADQYSFGSDGGRTRRIQLGLYNSQLQPSVHSSSNRIPSYQRSNVLAAPDEELREALEASLEASPLHSNQWLDVMMKCSSLSLLNFQMTSKWCKITIRSPSFRAKHEELSSSRRHSAYILFSTWNASKQRFYSVPIEPIRAAAASTRAIDLKTFDLVHREETSTNHYRAQSARGLILFSRSFKCSPHNDNVLLFYPATKKSVIIPPTRPRHASYSNISSTTYCLGYSSQSDSYKVLAFNWKDKDCSLKILTVPGSYSWTADRRNWRELTVENLPLVLESRYFVEYKRCVYHKGSIHWLNNYRELILSFDVEKEIFSTTVVQIPSDDSPKELLNLGGRLALVGCTTETVLWTSKDDHGKAWKQETIQMESDYDTIAPLSNPIDDRFLTWSIPEPSAMDPFDDFFRTWLEIPKIYFYNRANERTTSQNVQVDSGKLDEWEFSDCFADILLSIP